MSRLALCLLVLVGCQRTQPPAPPSAPAAAPEKPKVESDLAKTTLPAKSVKSLGIAVAAVQIRPVQDTLRLTGLIMPPIGYEATITAPLAGVVKLPPSGLLPIPGRRVTEGQVLFVLEPVLSPVEAVQLATLKRSVENEKTKAVEGERIAKAEFDRIVELKKEGLRGQQDVDTAHGKWVSAVEDVKAANSKLAFFTDAPREVRSPRGGMLMTLLATPGQTVPAAAPLATVADLSRLWIRVAVPESDLPRINRQESVTLEVKPTGLSGTPLVSHLVRADFVALVPQVDPVKHTADLFYELVLASAEQSLMREVLSGLEAVRWCGAMPDEAVPFFARDQMLTVAVPLDETRTECVVPVSSVLYDAYGGAWIYVEQPSSDKSTNVYERRRVELGPVVGDGVVVRPPCKEGERVVSVGAGALFSREFFKTPVKVEGDD